MGKRQKIVLISIASIMVLMIVGTLIAKSILTSKIENFLANSLPENIKVEYEDLDFSILSGSLKLAKPKLTMFGKTTDSIILMNKMTSLEVSNVGYWNYLVNDKITIESIQFNEPNITYRYNKLVESEDYEITEEKTFKQPVNVKKFQIVNGNASMFEFENDTLLLKLNSFNVELQDIHLDEKTSSQKVPFNLGSYSLGFDQLFYRMNKFDDLKIGKSKISADKTILNNFKLYTKYSKQELSRMISVERDHMDLTVDKITLQHEEFGYQQDSIFYFRSPNVEFSNPVFNIYRDKLQNDDETVKSLYSKMLRELKFDLTLSEVLLKNGTINYSEKVKPESGAGEISFTKMNVTIKNLGNTFASSEKTNLDIDAIFMKSTPIKVNWYFDVNNVNDQFIFKAEIGRLPGEDLNPFIVPNLKVKFEGELIKTYFTVDGNFHNSTVDLRSSYTDFKVNILDKEGKSKNKFLSTVANLFIKKDTDSEDDNFRDATKKSVERDKTKSVFNFLWLNAQAGLLSALTGDGKK